MRAVIQRVTSARVTVAGDITGEIGPGLLVLLGVTTTPSPTSTGFRKNRRTRIFEDDAGKMTARSNDLVAGVAVPAGPPCSSSQFTSAPARARHRRRSMTPRSPTSRNPLRKFLAHGNCPRRPACPASIARVACGKFGAMMQVALVNDGPVTSCSIRDWSSAPGICGVQVLELGFHRWGDNLGDYTHPSFLL